MTATPAGAAGRRLQGWNGWGPALAAGLAFFILFWDPMRTLGRDWWNDPDAGHGLLLGPLAVILAWRAGVDENARPQPVLGLVLLLGAVLLRYVSGIGAELFTMRMSMMGAAGALVVFLFGFRQILRWWLPAVLLVLSVPLPQVLLQTLAFPLQLKASQFGAQLLELRSVPVLLAGNVIHLPGQSLFVTEACSGLRSLTALIALGFLVGGLWLKTPWARTVLVAVTIPVAMVVNGVRVFATGFLVFFVDPSMGEGFMHLTEGWVLFVVAFVVLGSLAFGLSRIEGRFRGRRTLQEAAA